MSFFKCKTFAMHDQLPARLQRKDPHAIIGMTPDDQAPALSYIRDIVIINPKQSSPTTFMALPRILSTFPCLHRCTLLFGFQIHVGPKPEGEFRGGSDNVEWITAAFVLGGPVPLEMQEYVAAIGMPRYFKLEEAMGPSTNWAVHQEEMEKYVYPTLRARSKLLQSKAGRERVLASET